MEYFANEAYVEVVDGKKLEMKELPMNPADKELQLLLNSTNEAAKASNDELWTLQDLKDKFKRPNRKLCHYFLFHYDDKPIGGAMYMDPDDQCRAFSIGDFAIYKEYRGKGFGSKCFKMLLDKIKKSNSTLPIYLGVHVNNTKAIELYKKFGFKIAKTMEENGNKFHQMFLGKPINFKTDEKQNGATESLLDRDASNVVESKMYFANNNGKIPKDANGNIVLTKNITDATIYAAFDQFNDSKVAMACKGFMQYKNGTNKHVLVVHGDDSLTEPEEMDCVGTIYSVTLSEPIEFCYHGHRGFGKCQLPKIYTVKEEALKDAKIEKVDVVNFKATFEYEKSLSMQHTSEDFSQENFGVKDDRFVKDVILPAIKDDTLYHGSSQKLNVIKPFQLKELRDKNVKTISLTPYARLASLFCVPFRSIRENDKGQVIFHHCRMKLDEWFVDMPEEEMYKAVQTVHISHNIKQLPTIDKTYPGYLHYVHAEDALIDAGANPINGKGPYEVVSYVKELKPYKVESLKIRMIAKYSPSFAKECGMDAEPCEPEDVATEDFTLETTEIENTELDISATFLQEFNAGIEEFNRWVRDLELRYLRDELNDEQVTMAFEQIAQESILTDTVKTIFRKIGEFIAWFFRKLKDLWNYFFGKTQRGMRALKSANDLITRHKNSNGFFNDAAFEAAKAPQGLVTAVGLDQFLTSGFSPDVFSSIFNEMLDMWASRPEELYEEVFVKFNQAPTSHKWHYLLAYLPTKPGPDGMDGMKYAKTKHPATGTMRESAYDRESVFILLKEAMDAYVAYEKNSSLIATRGNTTVDAARRMIEYQDRTDITEREAVQLAKDIQELGSWMQVVFKSYQSGFEFILQQMNMVTSVYAKYMK